MTASPFGKLILRAAGMAAGVSLAVGLSGCIPPQPPTGPAVLTSDGQIITLESIQEVVDDEDLTDEEKRQGLRDLGITDEYLIDLFVNQL